ncbi:Uncharacterized protein GBIM_15504, partial [Gryllus bimaculatus]
MTVASFLLAAGPGRGRARAAGPGCGEPAARRGGRRAAAASRLRPGRRPRPPPAAADDDDCGHSSASDDPGWPRAPSFASSRLLLRGAVPVLVVAGVVVRRIDVCVGGGAQVNQDTDVTITGVYVNSTLTRSTRHEGFCAFAGMGMQYRISSTSHTQTESVATEATLLPHPPGAAGSDRVGSAGAGGEPLSKSYTPLGALSSMQPPGTGGRAAGRGRLGGAGWAAPHGRRRGPAAAPRRPAPPPPSPPPRAAAAAPAPPPRPAAATAAPPPP